MPKSMQELYKASEEIRADAVANEKLQSAQTGGEACTDTTGMTAPIFSEKEIKEYADVCTLPENAPPTAEELARQRAHDREVPKIEGILGIIKIKEDMMRRDPASFEPRDYEKGPDKG